MTQGPIRLPRWPAGRICLVDITPAAWEVPYHGASITLCCREGFFEDGAGMTWLTDVTCRPGHLEESLDENGRPHLTISDRLFRSLMPVGRPVPLVLAGYHMSFLRRILGGPHDRPPFDLCLYRGLRQLCPWVADFGLQLSAIELVPENIPLMTRSGPLARYACAETLLDVLLARLPVNRLVAMSTAAVPPPPEDEPLSGMSGWCNMTADRVFTADQEKEI
ncbi:hypothetical protein [Gluconobacter albidus]|uniref:hypothetical protein n=1 Tax=Gluconobacter albidus TaxID=318683 RepID=UPI0030AF6492